jgi:hypothetical protein
MVKKGLVEKSVSTWLKQGAFKKVSFSMAGKRRGKKIKF